MTDYHFGVLFRFVPAAMANISWIPVELRIGRPSVYKWRQYQTTYMTVNSQLGMTAYHVQDASHVYTYQPTDHQYLFDTVSVTNYDTLLNVGQTAALNYDDTYPFSLLYYSADIPALVRIVPSFNEGNANYRLDGSDVYTNWNHPQVGNNTLWATGASIVSMPNLDPFPGIITNFTMHYNNPPVTGTKSYYLQSIFTAGGKEYARFLPVP